LPVPSEKREVSIITEKISSKAKAMSRGKIIQATKPGRGESQVRKITGYGRAVIKNPA
jgi:hypothetical protein